MSNRLQDKICVVTGAAGGIGAAIARAFAAQGAQVVVTDIDACAGRAFAVELGAQARFAALDVTQEDQWMSVLEDVVRTSGGLDVLVNNAGVSGTGRAAADPENTCLSDWRRVLHINLDSVFLGCKHAIRTMRASGRQGSIINMSSRSGLVGIPHAAAYAASKAAIRNHSKTVALYCAEQNLGIRCNTIFPASIRTPMWDAMLGDKAEEAQLLANMPLHRFGRPDEVAAVAVMLASDEATYITASEFNIDGGILAGTATSPK